MKCQMKSEILFDIIMAIIALLLVVVIFIC